MENLFLILLYGFLPVIFGCVFCTIKSFFDQPIAKRGRDAPPNTHPGAMPKANLIDCDTLKKLERIK